MKKIAPLFLALSFSSPLIVNASIAHYGEPGNNKITSLATGNLKSAANAAVVVFNYTDQYYTVSGYTTPSQTWGDTMTLNPYRTISPPLSYEISYEMPYYDNQACISVTRTDGVVVIPAYTCYPAGFQVNIGTPHMTGMATSSAVPTVTITKR